MGELFDSLSAFETSSALLIGALLVVGAADLGLRWWVRRRLRSELMGRSGSGASGYWVTRTLGAVLSPLALLIWIHGGYFVALLLIRRFGGNTWTPPATAAADWLYGVGTAAALVWLLVRMGRLLETALLTFAARAETSWDDFVLPLMGRAIRRTLPLLAVILAAPALSAMPRLAEIVRSSTSLLLIGAVAVVLYQLVDGVATYVVKRHSLDVADNLRARSIYTQVVLLRKVAVAALGVFTIASMLMVFDSVRQFGASILASAGIAGIVVGFAAQRSLATLLAGFQIAMTQPIRVDDVVIVEGEWGRIEDITLTYAVVRIWDERRLVVPITYFIEQPFQNWTRTSSDLLCGVVVYVDYTVPVDAVRQELTRVLEASRHWDGRVNALQVTDAKEHTMELRALASAADASRAWDLRCEVREQLLAFVQRHHPESLPRIRASVDGLSAPLFAAAGRAGTHPRSR